MMTSWTARVEWTPSRPPTGAELGDILDRLAHYSPSVSAHQARSADGATETWAACISLQEGSLRKVTALAMALVERATGERATGVEVLRTSEQDRRVGEHSIPELVGYAEIAAMAGVSRQRARQLADLQSFPAAVARTQAGPLWDKAQVEAWIERWKRKSEGRPRLRGITAREVSPPPSLDSE